uniref:C2 repressor n=2 Tax=root TaxID=1 RepID=A0A8S5QGS6_9CAUD|nr:MAG TPA: C2 repressor [Siphoviridae sp. ctr8v12]
MREKMFRFDKYMKYRNLNDNQVTVECKLSQGLLSQARTGKSDLGNSTINKILNIYQDLNRVWLLTGEGEMLNSAYSNNRVTMNGNENISNIGGQNISISLPEEGSQKIIKPDGTVELHSMSKNIDNSNNTDKFIELLKKKDEQIDRLITLLEKK